MFSKIKRGIKGILRKSSGNRYKRIIEVRISKDTLINNYRAYREENNLPIAPVFKSNAYGHGLLGVAKLFDDYKEIPFYVIDSYHEAMKLRSAGIKHSLLIIGFTHIENVVGNRLKNISFMVGDMEYLKRLIEALGERKARVHIKLDTGMNRQGFRAEDIDEMLEVVTNSNRIEIEGLMSHFADADGDSPEFTNSQIRAWTQMKDQITKSLPDIKWFHISATAGSEFLDKCDTNMMRLGLGLYGYDPNPRSKVDIHPALRVETVVASVKKIKKGDKVGYNCTYTAPQDMTVAIIPEGYNTVIDRRLSNKGFIYINNHPCPIIGRVSMNITTVDASDVPGISIGDSVVLISDRPEDKNSFASIANMIGTNVYGVRVPENLHRVYI